MAAIDEIDGIREQILSVPEGLKVYAILDGASAEQLPRTIDQYGIESVCLLRGELDPDLAQAAPYLVRLFADSPFTDWVLSEGWGKHWGIFVVTTANLRTLRQHFRSFLTVYDPDNVPLFFRYYDPRVLRVYLPTCETEELEDIFGPVDRYLMEGDDGKTLMRCELKDGELLCQ